MAEKSLPPLAASPPDVLTIRTTRSQVHALERFRTKRPPGITGRPLSLIARELYGKQLTLPRGSSLGHLRGIFLRTPFHFLGRHVFHVLRQAPLVAKRIGDLAVAVAPELIFERHVHFRPSRHRAIEGRIHIFQIEEDPARILHSRSRRGVHAR